MNCTEIRASLDSYLDEAVDSLERGQIDGHLAGCAGCRDFCAERRNLIQAIQGAPYYHAPPDLLDQVLTRVETRAHPVPRRSVAWAASLVMALVLGLGLGAGITYHIADLQSERHLLQDVVASHVRSQMLPGRMTDVASSDRHQVKPWFSGKLDFAPPVRDFAADGFPLVGGRIDYLGERAVAALVYRHSQHVINLYVWPVAEQAELAATASSYHGYSLLHWRQQGMEYWLVSDLNPTSLASFSQILQRMI